MNEFLSGIFQTCQIWHLLALSPFHRIFVYCRHYCCCWLMPLICFVRQLLLLLVNVGCYLGTPCWLSLNCIVVFCAVWISCHLLWWLLIVSYYIYCCCLLLVLLYLFLCRWFCCAVAFVDIFVVSCCCCSCCCCCCFSFLLFCCICCFYCCFSIMVSMF